MIHYRSLKKVEVVFVKFLKEGGSKMWQEFFSRLDSSEIFFWGLMGALSLVYLFYEINEIIQRFLDSHKRKRR